MEEKVGFALIALKTEQFATFEENFSDEKNSTLKTELEFKVNKEKKQVGVFTTFTFEQTEKAFLKIQISCHFGIDPESWDKLCSDSKNCIPKRIHGTFNHDCSWIWKRSIACENRREII